MIKRNLKPIKNSVVCKRVNEKNEVKENNLVLLKTKNVDLYKILSYSVDNKEDFPYEVGDIVMSTSTGDEIEINDNEIVYLFKTEHIMCKVED